MGVVRVGVAFGDALQIEFLGGVEGSALEHPHWDYVPAVPYDYSDVKYIPQAALRCWFSHFLLKASNRPAGSRSEVCRASALGSLLLAFVECFASGYLLH